MRVGFDSNRTIWFQLGCAAIRCHRAGSPATATLQKRRLQVLRLSPDIIKEYGDVRQDDCRSSLKADDVAHTCRLHVYYAPVPARPSLQMHGPHLLSDQLHLHIGASPVDPPPGPKSLKQYMSQYK